MICDVESFRLQVHQRFAFFDGDEDDDGFAALVKSNEQLAADFEGWRAVRSALFSFGQGRRNMAHGFPIDGFGFAGALHKSK